MIKNKGIYDGTKFDLTVTKEGTNQSCYSGDIATVNYKGTLKSDGSTFDSTDEKGAFSFTLGQAEVIECWDTGLKKMKVG